MLCILFIFVGPHYIIIRVNLCIKQQQKGPSKKKKYQNCKELNECCESL